MNELTPLERAVLEQLFAGDQPILKAFLAQARRAQVVSREMTGVGFYTYLTVPEEVPDASVHDGAIQFGDVVAEFDGVGLGAGFLIWIKDRRLHFLEGYTFDTPWPDDAKGFRLSYANPDRSEAMTGLGLKPGP